MLKKTFYPAETVIITVLLAVVPYLMLRGIVEQIAQWWLAHTAPARLLNEAPDDITAKSGTDQISVELSSRRTGMSFQRTRMSADRTLMSVIRTSLSLIIFGFTIFQVFEKLPRRHHPPRRPRRAISASRWSLLGILMLIGGIVYHVRFMSACAKNAQG